MSNTLKSMVIYELPNGEAFNINGGDFVTHGPAKYINAPVPVPIDWGFYYTEGIDYSNNPYRKYLYLTPERYSNFVNKVYPNVWAESRTTIESYDYAKLMSEVDALSVSRKNDLTQMAQRSFDGVMVWYYPSSFGQYVIIVRNGELGYGPKEYEEINRKNVDFLQGIINNKLTWLFKGNQTEFQFFSDAEMYYYCKEHKQIHGVYPMFMDKCIAIGWELAVRMNEKMIKVLNLR